jgi:hypothetical protein
LDIGGDSWNINGLNCEFSEIIIRQGPSASTLVEGCHFETSKMLFTNADTLPTITTSPWTDNGGTGQGWSGSTTFLNTYVAFTAVGTQNGVAAPLFVIKSQASFTGSLSIIGCTFAVPNSLATISTSFDRTAATSTITGLKVFIAGTGGNSGNGFLDPATIVSDVYSNYVRLDSSTYGVESRFGTVKIDKFNGDASGQNAYKLGGFTEYRLADSSAKLVESGSHGTSVQGYTKASLLSSFYTQGVKMEWNTFVPTVDNQCSLGSGALKWSAVYAANGAIQTSDRNAKTDIQDTTLGLSFINSLKPRRYKMIESGRVTEGKVEEYTDDDGNVLKRIKPGSQEPIPGQRFHEGLIAQEVKESLDAAGIDSAIWIDDPAGGQGLRYEEFIAPLIKAVQQLSAEVAQLKDQLNP